MNIPRGYEAGNAHIYKLSCLTQWQRCKRLKLQLEMSKVEIRHMIWKEKERKVATRSVSEALIPLCWLWSIVRKIELIPWAWTPSIFCLQSIFMNPQGCCGIKHINNQSSGWAGVCAQPKNTQKTQTTAMRTRDLH